jgi:hypothetical protein
MPTASLVSNRSEFDSRAFHVSLSLSFSLTNRNTQKNADEHGHDDAGLKVTLPFCTTHFALAATARKDRLSSTLKKILFRHQYPLSLSLSCSSCGVRTTPFVSEQLRRTTFVFDSTFVSLLHTDCSRTNYKKTVCLLTYLCRLLSVLRSPSSFDRNPKTCPNARHSRTVDQVNQEQIKPQTFRWSNSRTKRKDFSTFKCPSLDMLSHF